MKKRVLAALLALVMLFGALPMSVFAEDLETVEEPSGTFEPDEPEKYTYHLYYDFNNVGTGSTKWNIEYGPTADTSYTYTVDSQTLTCREGYNFLGWADGKNATEPDYRGGDTITLTWQNPTKTIYAVWKEKTQPQPDITDPTDFAKTTLTTELKSCWKACRRMHGRSNGRPAARRPRSSCIRRKLLRYIRWAASTRRSTKALLP